MVGKQQNRLHIMRALLNPGNKDQAAPYRLYQSTLLRVCPAAVKPHVLFMSVLRRSTHAVSFVSTNDLPGFDQFSQMKQPQKGTPSI